MASTSSSASKKKIRLKSADGEHFEVDEDIAMQSKTIKQILAEISIDDEIPLPNVKAKILSKVIEYCKNHAESLIDKDCICSVLAQEDLKQWQSDFLNVDQETLFDLMLAANYLDIKSLLELTCKHVADLMKGKTVDQIRNTFHIVNDYSPEEEAEIKKDLAWAFE